MASLSAASRLLPLGALVLIACGLLRSDYSDPKPAFTGTKAPPPGSFAKAIDSPTLPGGATELGRVDVTCERLAVRYSMAPIKRLCSWNEALAVVLREATMAGGDGIFDIQPARGTWEARTDTLSEMSARVFRFPRDFQPTQKPKPKPQGPSDDDF